MREERRAARAVTECVNGVERDQGGFPRRGFAMAAGTSGAGNGRPNGGVLPKIYRKPPWVIAKNWSIRAGLDGAVEGRRSEGRLRRAERAYPRYDAGTAPPRRPFGRSEREQASTALPVPERTRKGATAGGIVGRGAGVGRCRTLMNNKLQTAAQVSMAYCEGCFLACFQLHRVPARSISRRAIRSIKVAVVRPRRSASCAAVSTFWAKPLRIPGYAMPDPH